MCERALLQREPRAASVLAAEGDAPLKCLSISKSAFEEVLGPLQEIINADAEWKHKLALVKQLRKNAAGLGNAKPADFHLYGMQARAARRRTRTPASTHGSCRCAVLLSSAPASASVRDGPA